MKLILMVLLALTTVTAHADEYVTVIGEKSEISLKEYKAAEQKAAAEKMAEQLAAKKAWKEAKLAKAAKLKAQNND